MGQIHILVTPDLKKTMPDTVKIVFETDCDIFALDPKTHQPTGTVKGMNSILEANDPQIFIDWLKPHGKIWVGSGVPQFEEFELCELKDHV